MAGFTDDFGSDEAGRSVTGSGDSDLADDAGGDGGGGGSGDASARGASGGGSDDGTDADPTGFTEDFGEDEAGRVVNPDIDAGDTQADEAVTGGESTAGTDDGSDFDPAMEDRGGLGAADPGDEAAGVDLGPTTEAGEDVVRDVDTGRTVGRAVRDVQRLDGTEPVGGRGARDARRLRSTDEGPSRGDVRAAVTQFSNQQLQAQREQFGDIDFSAGLGDPNVDEVEQSARQFAATVDETLPEEPDEPRPTASQPVGAGPAVSPTPGIGQLARPGTVLSREARGLVTGAAATPVTALEAVETTQFLGEPAFSSPTLAATTGGAATVSDPGVAEERFERAETTAEGVVRESAEAVRENPRDVVVAAGLGTVASVGSGVALSRGARLARSRARTVGATEIDAEDLTGEDVLEANRPDGDSGQTFPPVREDVGPEGQAAALQRQAEEFTPEEVTERLGGDAPEGTIDAKKALDVEPEGEGGGRGFKAPESDTAEAGAFETPGTSVGPELSPFFFRETPSARFSPVPGLPDLGGKPTAAVIRTEVRDTDAGDVEEFTDELLAAEDAGERGAFTMPPDEFSPGEAELVIPPGATFEQVTDASALRRAGLGSELAVRTPGGQRAPVRVFRDPDVDDPGAVDVDDAADLEGTPEIDTQAEAVEVTMREIRRQTRQGRQPVERPLPLAPAGGGPGATTTSAADADGTRTSTAGSDQRVARPAADTDVPTTSATRTATDDQRPAESGVTVAERDVSGVSETSRDAPTSRGGSGGATSRGGESSGPSPGGPSPPSEGGGSPPTSRGPPSPPTSPPGRPPSSPPGRPPGSPPGGPPTSPPPTRPPDEIDVDTDDDEKFEFDVAADFAKRFGAGVAAPEVVQTGDIEDLSDAGESFTETVDADTTPEVTDVAGDASAATDTQRQALQDLGVDPADLGDGGG